MSAANPGAANLRIHGTGTCAGGMHPEPTLDNYPLLCWTQEHDRFGSMVVHTEDQKASVHDIALAFAETPGIEAVADRFSTTVEHVAQAVRYADEWLRLRAAR